MIDKTTYVYFVVSMFIRQRISDYCDEKELELSMSASISAWFRTYQEAKAFIETGGRKNCIDKIQKISFKDLQRTIGEPNG